MTRTVHPFLTPEDLGIDLEEDSTDITDEDVAGATDTDNESDFVQKATAFLVENNPPSGYGVKMRRKGGILYVQYLVGGVKTLFKTEWMRRPHGL